MSNTSKIITRTVLELGLAFAGVTLGMEVRSCQETDKCKQLLMDNQIVSQYFCENSQLRWNYLHRIDETNDPRLAYEQVLREYCEKVQCPPH